MFNSIKLKLAKRHTERMQKEREWIIQINDDYWLKHPLKYRQMEQWDIWGKMQTEVLSRILKHFNNPVVYWRFHTYFPDRYSGILETCVHTTIFSDKDKGDIIILKDCKDHAVWEQLMSVAGLVSMARCIYILDNNPDNWINAINRFFEITEEIYSGSSPSEFIDELNSCKCLMYSEDEDLIIEKVDLSESLMLSILHSVASEYDLDLIIERKL